MSLIILFFVSKLIWFCKEATGTSKLIKMKHTWQLRNYYTLYHCEHAPEIRDCISDEEMLWLKNACACPRLTKPVCITCTKNVGARPRLNPPSPNDSELF